MTCSDGYDTFGHAVSVSSRTNLSPLELYSMLRNFYSGLMQEHVLQKTPLTLQRPCPMNYNQWETIAAAFAGRGRV